MVSGTKLEPEGRASARLTVDPDGATVLLDELLRALRGEGHARSSVVDVRVKALNHLILLIQLRSDGVRQNADASHGLHKEVQVFVLLLKPFRSGGQP